MAKSNEKNKIGNLFGIVIIVALCAVMISLDFIPIEYVEDERKNFWISKIIQQICGTVAVILLMLRLKIRLFSRPQGWLYLIPCVIIAVDNFPFWSYFSGNMQFVSLTALDFILFAVYCLAIGLFEECVFRGVVFSALAGCFSKDRKGFLKTYIFSSLLFGLAHLFNLFMGASLGATLLQVGYTVLTGGLFAFALIKTKNVFCAAFIHALYNFCGLLLSERGLGSGVVFDGGTTVMMAIVSVLSGVFVLYSVWKYPENERIELYKRLGIEEKEN